MHPHLSEKHKENIYYFSILILYILYLFTFFRVVYLDEHYVKLFNIIIQIGICAILILRFNPYNEHRITSFDKTLIISATSFLLFNLFVTEVYSAYIIHTQWYNGFSQKIKSYIKNINPNI